MGLMISAGLSAPARGGVRVAPPSAFAPEAWSLTDRRSDGALTVRVTAMPESRGAALTHLECSVDDGAWRPLDPDGLGAYRIAGLVNERAVSVRLRAVSAAGAGAPGAAKTATPTFGFSVADQTVAFGALTRPGEGAARLAGVGVTAVEIVRADAPSVVIAGDALTPSGAAPLRDGDVATALVNGTDLVELRLAVIPGAYSVATDAELKAAAETAGLAFGERILWRGGDVNRGKTDFVIQRAAPVSGTFDGANHVVIEPHEGAVLRIWRLTLRGDATSNTGGFRLTGATFCAERDAAFSGTVAYILRLIDCPDTIVEDFDSDITPVDQYGARDIPSGFKVVRSDRVTMRRGTLTTIYIGIQTASARFFTLERVTVRRAHKDTFMFGAPWQGLTLRWVRSEDRQIWARGPHEVLELDAANPARARVSLAAAADMRQSDPRLYIRSLKLANGAPHPAEKTYVKYTTSQNAANIDLATGWITFEGVDGTGWGDAFVSAGSVIEAVAEHNDHIQFMPTSGSRERIALTSDADLSDVTIENLILAGGANLSPYYGGQGFGFGSDGGVMDGAAGPFFARNWRIDGLWYYDSAVNAWPLHSTTRDGFFRDIFALEPPGRLAAAYSGIPPKLEFSPVNSVFVSCYAPIIRTGSATDCLFIDVDAAPLNPRPLAGDPTIPAHYAATFVDPKPYGASTDLARDLAIRPGGALAARPTGRVPGAGRDWTTFTYTPDAVPAAFGAGDWSIAEENGLKITIASLPAAGDYPIMVIQMQVDGGSWTDLGLTGPGARFLPLPAGAHEVALRAVSAAGPGPVGERRSIVLAASAYVPAFVASGQDGYIDLTGAGLVDAAGLTLRLRLASNLPSTVTLLQCQGRTTITVNADGSIGLWLIDANGSTVIYDGATAVGVVAPASTAADAADIDITASVAGPGGLCAVTVRVNGVDVSPASPTRTASPTGLIDLTRATAAMLATATGGMKANAIIADLLLDLAPRAATEFRRETGAPADPRGFAPPFLLVGGPVAGGQAALTGGGIVNGTNWVDA